MISLKNYKKLNHGLPDLLNWGSMIDNGIILNKDGSLMAGYFYAGKDLSILSYAEKSKISAILNATLARLGSEFMIHQDSIRVPCNDYPSPKECFFPDPISRMIDDERRRSFESYGKHFENIQTFFITFLPENVAHNKAVRFLFDHEETLNKRCLVQDILDRFKGSLAELEDRLSSVISLERMQGQPFQDEFGQTHIEDQQLQCLHFYLTGLNHKILLPPCPMYLDSVIGGHEFWTGVIPKIEDQFIQTISIEGFPLESYPGILSELDQLPLAYRFSNRFIFLDNMDAQKQLRSYKRKWQQKVRGFVDQVFNTERTAKSAIDQDAQNMVDETDAAMADANRGLVTYGYYSSTIIIMHEDRSVLEDSSRFIKRLINNLGFLARIETINTVEAFLGSLPGHSQPNLRRPLIHTLNLADFLPISTTWVGQKYVPCPFFPPNSPALLYVSTSGSTPLRFNLHVSDVGHLLMFGPTGNGKSVALALIVVQFLKYKNASIFCFDKGSSLETLIRACGGIHHNITFDDTNDLCFSPLSKIDEPGELSWIEDWIQSIFELQGLSINPNQRKELHRALQALKRSASPKTLTNLQIELQDRAMKAALEEYTVSGNLGLMLDQTSEHIDFSHLNCFEIEQLMNRKDRVKIPILTYLFHLVERNLKGQPALIVLDEAWLMLDHDLFKEKIREWLKVLRKANCSVILATQSLSDAVNSKILDVLIESCPSKIFLANTNATTEDNQLLYKAMGCTDSEIQTISNMIPKREYFIKGEGRRVVDLDIGPIALSFLGVSSKDDLRLMREMATQEGWTKDWLQNRGVCEGV